MTTPAMSELYAKVAEHVEATNQALELLEESDKHWRGRLHTIEDRQSKSLGLTRTDFDKVYYKAMSSVQLGLGHLHDPPSLRQFKFQLSSSTSKLSAMSPDVWSGTSNPTLRVPSLNHRHYNDTTATLRSPSTFQLRPATSE